MEEHVKPLLNNMSASKTIDVLKKDALFLMPDFLGADFSSRLCDEINSAKKFLTPLEDFEKRIERKEKLAGRPNAVFDIPVELQEKLEGKILDVKPVLEKHFSTELDELKLTYYAIYHTGDFFERHADAASNAKNINGVRQTKLVIVVFLNDNADDETDKDSFSGYTGGQLTIYGLIKDKKFEHFGYPLSCKAGTLVAFRSTCLHEVAEVTSGTRYVVNSGFY